MYTSAGMLKKLKSRGSRKNIEGMARFGITTERRLGVSVPEMRRIAREAGTDHALAIRLWNSGVAEARIVASMIADPAKMTAAEMDRWVSGFDSWDVCDQVCTSPAWRGTIKTPPTRCAPGSCRLSNAGPGTREIL